jgi:hypothetical protein
MLQELCSLQVGVGIRSGQIKLSGQIGTLRPIAAEFWKNSEYQIHKEFITFLTRGRTQNSDLKRRIYDWLKSSNSLKEGLLISN